MAISSYTPTGKDYTQKVIGADNYLDLQTSGWAQQHLPDLMEKEAEVFGKRTISGFLSQVSAEEAMSADQVIWSEQGRLHLAYECDMLDVTASTINITKTMDGVAQTSDHGINIGDMVLIAGGGQTVTARVSVADSSSATITVTPYGYAHMTNAGFVNGDNTCKLLVFGSEWGKGTENKVRSNKPVFNVYDNKPVIIKDMYEVSGSDAAQVGWVEVSGEEGQNGYYWYLKAAGDTRARFTDYLEMVCIEAEKNLAASNINTGGGAASADDSHGTEGLFKAITSRGHQSSGITGVNAATDLAEFDAMLAAFDENGAIEENMMFVNRATALAIDDMLASMNSYGAGGTSYGVFDNSEDMALNLGFSGFRRGSYDFYKSDWKYLNDGALRAGLGYNDIRGVVIPAGTSSVYDEMMGKNMKRPFLHMRYRASNMESRKLKTWITDSVGAATSDLDAMTVNYLSERCLVVQGGNNFMLLN